MKMLYKRRIPIPHHDWNYLLNPDNRKKILDNILRRKEKADICKLQEMGRKCMQITGQEIQELTPELNAIANSIPNRLHPRWEGTSQSDESPVVLETRGRKREFAFKPKAFADFATSALGYLATTSKFCGDRSYAFARGLAELEIALCRYALSIVQKEGFQLVSVPDLVSAEVIESAGFPTESEEGEKTPVYHIDHGFCLSGTGEMGIASLLINRVLPLDSLPLKLCTVSECFRSEADKSGVDRGLFRVHQFKKVEMFAVGTDSDELLEEILRVQKQIFDGLELNYQIVDIPPSGLGLSARRKFDSEAWMPGRQGFGEISSASSCGDYQARRLNLRGAPNPGPERPFLQTANGTAIAVPRAIIALCENGQDEDIKEISLPKVLKDFMPSKSCVVQALPKKTLPQKLLPNVVKKLY